MTVNKREPPSLSSLKQISYLAKYGKIGLAARALGITHSALSMTISRVETELGVPLFSKGAANLVATEVAIELTMAYQDAADRLETAMGNIGNILDGRVVRISAPHDLHEHLISETIRRFVSASDLQARFHIGMELEVADIDIRYVNQSNVLPESHLIDETATALVAIGVDLGNGDGNFRIIASNANLVQPWTLKNPEYRNRVTTLTEGLSTPAALNLAREEGWVALVDQAAVSKQANLPGLTQLGIPARTSRALSCTLLTRTSGPVDMQLRDIVREVARELQEET